MKRIIILSILFFILLINKGYCYYRNYYDYNENGCYCSYNRCRCVMNKTRYLIRQDNRNLRSHYYTRNYYGPHSHHLINPYNYKHYYNSYNIIYK